MNDASPAEPPAARRGGLFGLRAVLRDLARRPPATDPRARSGPGDLAAELAGRPLRPGPRAVWFDPHFYATRPGVPSGAGYEHFLAHGLAEGRFPSAAVERLVKVDGGHLEAADFEALSQVSPDWDGDVSPYAMLTLAGLYHPAWHDHVGSTFRGFIAYLGAGARTAPGPLFDPALYRERADAAGLSVPADDSAALHWTRHGHAARIVPTDRYDEDEYRHAYPDIGASILWGFEHFVLHGAAEGRLPRRRRGFQRAPAWGQTPTRAMFDEWLAADRPAAANASGQIDFARHAKRLGDLLASRHLTDVLARARRLEPDVGDIATIAELLLPPHHDPLAPAHAEILRRLPGKTYETVICVPSVRGGGANLVAGLLGHALSRIRPNERVLYLRTDDPRFDGAKWLPSGAEMVDIADVARSVPPPVAEHLLRLVLRGVTARRVFNVNSRLCWMMLRDHGANLALTLNTYGYMFCWDQTPTGLRVGDPTEFFAVTAGTMTAFLTDTAWLRAELSAIYRLPEAARAKIVHLPTPARTPVRLGAMARAVADPATPDSQHLVLWAGELDRRDRFDLVLDIARRMPDVTFRCWIETLPDASGDLATPPANVTMRGGLADVDELPLARAGAWLFTALWAGLPPILIELATRGVAVVASAVGGVPELIAPGCGWPIPPDASTDDYVSALRHALNDPLEAATRAEALRCRVAARHAEPLHDAALHALLAAEKPF